VQKAPEVKKSRAKAPPANDTAEVEKKKTLEHSDEKRDPGATHTRRPLREAVSEAKGIPEPGATFTRKQLREAVSEAKQTIDPGATFTRKQLREAVSEAKRITDPGATQTRRPLQAVAEAKQAELDLLKGYEADLKTAVLERDQRIHALQLQLVALHREAKTAGALRTEVKELRAALAKAEKKLR
jgi:hypothetical protein